MGQCVVTTLLVLDYFGGEIIHDIKNKHYWNRLDDSNKIDLTQHQFPTGTIFNADEVIERNSLFPSHTKTEERYMLLKRNVEKFLN